MKKTLQNISIKKVPEWMLQIKRPSKTIRRILEKRPIQRENISNYNQQKKRKSNKNNKRKRQNEFENENEQSNDNNKVIREQEQEE